MRSAGETPSAIDVAGPGAAVGPVAALAAYGWWGLAPIFWKQFDDVAAIDVTAWRVVTTMVLMAAIVGLSRRRVELHRAVRSQRTRRALVASSLLIGANWGLFVWAVDNDRVVEASLGYFMNPLVSVGLGVVLLGERLDPARRWAVLLAVAGVAWLTLAIGSFPWVSVVLATSFALYGLIRKLVPIDPFVGLGMETATLTLPALAVLALGGNVGADLARGPNALLVLFTGVVTAVPLLLFAVAAGRIDLSALGLLQYVAPTLQLLVGVVIYDEVFDGTRLVGYSAIWAGLVVFAIGELRHSTPTARRARLSAARGRVGP